MATTLELQLSKDTEKIGIEVSPGKIEQKLHRDAELIMLASFAEAAANAAKKLTEVNICLDLVETFNNVTDAEAVVTISKDDVKRLVDSFEATAGHRAIGWFRYCRSMLKQLQQAATA